jgi:hypothetical protein
VSRVAVASLLTRGQQAVDEAPALEAAEGSAPVGPPTLQHCLDLFQKPEQLSTENMWY